MDKKVSPIETQKTIKILTGINSYSKTQQFSKTQHIQDTRMNFTASRFLLHQVSSWAPSISPMSMSPKKLTSNNHNNSNSGRQISELTPDFLVDHILAIGMTQDINLNHSITLANLSRFLTKLLCRKSHKFRINSTVIQD